MRRALALLIAVALLAVAPAPAKEGSLTQHTYRARDGRTRAYWMYVPSRPRENMPMVVVLHGCIQTAEGAARTMGWNRLAERKRFLVVYPQQNLTAPSSYPAADGNGMGCWNWFHPDHQVRGAGEPELIAGITRAVAKKHGADTKRLYLQGVSAGADMAAILAATYPDLYASVAIYAGCAYATCSDSTGELAYAAMGPRARVVPVFWAQGSTDTLNVLPMGTTALEQWLGTNDLADDGQLNASIPRAPSSVEHRALEQSPSPGSGDACIHNNSWTCPGGVLGFEDEYPHTISRWEDTDGCVVVEAWAIHGMTHAYPGATATGDYTEPLGPDITRATYAFFTTNTRARRCV